MATLAVKSEPSLMQTNQLPTNGSQNSDYTQKLNMARAACDSLIQLAADSPTELFFERLLVLTKLYVSWLSEDGMIHKEARETDKELTMEALDNFEKRVSVSRMLIFLFYIAG